MFTKKSTTLSFEGNIIRCLTVKGDQVEAWDQLTLPPKHMSQGLIHSPNGVSKHLGRVLEKTEANRRHVVTGVTDQRSVHRLLTLPKIDEKLLDETIRRKSKQEFALPIDEVDIFWQIIGRNDKQLRIYVLAVPKQIIDHLVQTLQQVRIKPQVMSAKPLALMRAVGRQNSIIINLESFSMAVIIVVDGVPVIVRTVPLESGDLTREAKLDLLGQELNRTTKFYNESNKQNRLPEDTPLFPTGALFTSLSPEDRLEDNIPLVGRLQTRTSYPIFNLKPHVAAPAALSLPEFAVNLGLATKL